MIDPKLPGFRVSLHLTLIGILLILLAVGNGVVVWNAIPQIQDDVKLINELGIIRGSIQRVAKFEGAYILSDRLIREVDQGITHFLGRKSILQEDSPEVEFLRRVQILEKQWQQMKNSILIYREIPSENHRANMIQRSEMCWNLANDAVFKAQLFSETQAQNLYKIFIILGANILILLFVLWLVRNFVRNSLEQLAHYDFLTRLLNRHSYHKLMETEMIRSQRYRHPLSLILIDIDHFKQVNDTYGHKVGDEVLQRLADILRESVRAYDYVARIGGEEFAVIAPETKLKNAKNLAERLRQNVSNSRFSAINTLTISLGATEFHPQEDQNLFFRRADHALYQAKEKGRNQVVVE